MQWDKLLSEKTIANMEKRKKPSKVLEATSVSSFEEDYQMVVASAAFRRLQDKTQVFPLDKSDFVRTRLTHSIETSTIAKQLGSMVYKFYVRNNKKTSASPFDGDARQNMCDVLACAGLLHDLGNPPFGHFGEAIIGDWFQRFFKENKAPELTNMQMRHDLQYFNGNAQSIRLIAKSHLSKSNRELDITCAVVQTLLKYPFGSDVAKQRAGEADPEKREYLNSKFGHFYSEKAFIDTILKETGTLAYARHPLTHLLEAADDIAYATADLEDAFKKEFFTLRELVHFYKNEIETLKNEKQGDTKSAVEYALRLIAPLEEPQTKADDATTFNNWVKFARDWLMYCAAFGFDKQYSKIMNGTYEHDLLHDTYHELSIKALKRVMTEFVYDSGMIVRPELSAQTIITFLLDRLVPAALNHGKEGCSASDNKYYNLISENYRNDYNYAVTETDADRMYHKLLMVTDFISGMTDSYARNLYLELSGIM